LKATVITIVAATVLSGCVSDITDLFPGNQPIPSETVSELMVRGASLGSISPRHTPLPYDIGATRLTDNPDMISGGELSITILPNDFVNANSNNGYFLYAFSRSLGSDVYELLLNQRFAVDGVPVKTFLDLYEGELYRGMESLSEIADYVLGDSTFFLPVNATHLELYFLPDSESDADPVFVERWDLSGFYGYDRYLAPLIQ